MGYIHDTHMSQFIPPTAFHFSTATMTQIAGQVAGTISLHRAANNQTSLITIPVMIPSNSIALKGAYLVSVELDYENTTAAISTSMTPTVYSVARGADTAVAVVSTLPSTYTPVQANLLLQDQVKCTVTLTTPVWIDNDVYILVQFSLVAGAGGSTQEFLGAVANYTLRL